MRLHSLALVNFRQHADTRVEFGSGITGIIGPNGSGKSTMLEAIAWALYGNEAARGRRDSIRFIRADARAPVRVELDFELAGHRYRVVRGLTTAELYLDGGAEPVANSITSVGQMLYRRLGMTRVEFFNTYFTGQKELALMASLGPSERGQFLSRVLGYERLRAAQDAIRDRRRSLTHELKGLSEGLPDKAVVARAVAEASERSAAATRNLDDARITLARSEDALTQLTPRWEAAQRAREERQRVQTELKLAEQKLETARRDEQRAAEAVAKAAEAAALLEQIEPQLIPFGGLLAERDQLAILAREEGRRQTTEDAIRAAESDVQVLAARRAEIADAPEREESAVAAVDAARKASREIEEAHSAAHTDWVRDRQEAATRREELRRQYAELKGQRDVIVDAGEDGICPTCQRPLGANFRGVLDVLDAQLDAVRVEGNYFRGRVEQLEAQPSSLAELAPRRAAAQQALDAAQRLLVTVQGEAKALVECDRDMARHERRLAGLRADLATLPTGYDRARHDTVIRELERLGPLHDRFNRLQGAAEQGEKARAEQASAVDSGARLSASVASLRESLEKSAAGDAVFEANRAEFEKATRQVRDAREAYVRADAEAGAAAEAHARAREAAADAARREARIDEVTRERRVHDELDRTYTDLRADLNAVLRPELSKTASEFLSELTDGRYTELDLDDQYNLVVVEDGAPKPVISGGEEDVANLVMRLAISQMIAERAGQSFSLLVLDEVFGALDENRRQQVLDLLRGLQARFEQVVLITHIEAIRDGCDRVLSVRYDPGSGASVVDAPPAIAEEELIGSIA